MAKQRMENLIKLYIYFRETAKLVKERIKRYYNANVRKKFTSI